MASGKQAVFEDADNGQLLVTALSRFALQLYKEQAKEKSNGNAFMSPFSISAVLNMALLGSRGTTWTEMKTTLFLDALKDDTKLHQAFSDLISHLKRCSRPTEVFRYKREPFFQLHMANRIYGEKSCKILDEFQTSCKKYYDAGLLPVSFVNEPKKAVEEINSWVLEQTNQKIKDIISPDIIDATTRLVLVNAIYFKSAWQAPFEKDDTKDDDFFVSPTETLRIKMMFHKNKSASYYESSDLLCQVLKLPYLRGALSMFILLPYKASSLEALEKRLTAAHLGSIDSGFKQHFDVKLWLPKFKIEETLEMSEVLKKMGMKSLFMEGSADLSGIDGTRELYASKVVHKAFVDVNEAGTEAAAATAMTISSRCAILDLEEVDFRADRPFLFFIREERTKSVLFLGRVVRPEHF